MSLFDFFDNQDPAQVNANTRPIWTIGNLDKDENEKALLKWLNSEVDFLRQENMDRVDEIKKHYQLYKGLSLERIARSDERDRLIDRNRIQRKVVINHLYDLTEQRVAKFVKFKPSTAILPTNDEFSDKQASKLAKRIVDHIKYVQRYDLKNQDAVRVKEIAGESYLFIDWNPELGEEHPQSMKSRQGEEKVPLLDSNGNPELNENGEPIYIKDPIMIGDVEFTVERPEKMLMQKSDCMENVKYFFRIRTALVDELKVKYPKKADKIKMNQDSDFFNQHSAMDKKTAPQETLYFEFWHIHTKEMPTGRKVVFTSDVILENKEHPYSHGGFPFERLSAIDVPGEQYARSFYINSRQIAAQINNLTTMILRNQKICSSPKWMMPRGAAKIDDLHNDISIVQYKGPIAPTLAQANPTPVEVFNFRDILKGDLQQISGIGGQSRGEPPPGIKAGVALQFLDEQENNRFNADVVKYNEFQRRVVLKTLSVIGDFYKDDDERTISIVGKHDEFTRMGVDVKKLSRPFDVRIQNASALPESKAARIQTIIDMRQQFGPEIIRDDLVVDLMDFGQAEEYTDEIAAAVRTAQVENEKMNEGEMVDPELWEYHIQHWTIHVIDIQKPGFRDLPKDVQEKKKDHILAHEMLMLDISKKNPTFLEKAMMLPQFPLFYTPETMAPEPEITPQQAVSAEITAQEIGGANPIQVPEASNPAAAGSIDQNPDLPNISPGGAPINATGEEIQ